jgi:DNA-binding Lrp family transcriptional regulator
MSKKRKGLWIPGEVLNNKKLDFTNKVLLSEIMSLSKLENGCTASNSHFAELIETNPAAVSKRLNKLEQLGFIRRTNHFNNKQCIGRSIRVNSISGSSVGNNIVVPITPEGSSLTTINVVPNQPEGSSYEYMEVVPEEPEGSSNRNTINTITNSDILIQEKIQNINTVNKDNLTSALKNSDTGLTNQLSSYNDINEDGLQKIRNELIAATEFGKVIIEFYVFGYSDRIIKCIGEEKFIELEPKLFEYKQLLFK